jgi:outer membrane protein assembly factor BamB
MRSRVLLAAAALSSFMVPLGASAVALSSPTADAAVSGGEQDATAFQMTSGHTGVSTDLVGPDWTKAWSVAGAGNFSYALIADHQVFALIDVSGDFTLIAYNATNGTTDWSVDVHHDAVGITYASGRVFVANSLGGGTNVSAYDAGTGASEWTVTLTTQNIFTSAPTAANGYVYVDGASTGGALYAFRQSDGGLQWEGQVLNGDDSSPAANSSEVLGSYSCDLTQAFDASSGNPNWTYDDGCEGGGGQTAVLADGDVFLHDRILNASTGKNVRPLTAAVPPAVDAQNVYSENGTELNNDTENGGVLQAQTVADGTTLWSQSGDGGFVSSPIEVNGVVYEGSWTGKVFGYSAETGQQVWSTDVGTSLNWNPMGNYQDSIWGLSEGDDLLAVPAQDTLTVFAQTGTPPSAPSGVTATAGSDQATVSWTVPGDNGHPITDYTITPSADGVAGTPFVIPAGGTPQTGGTAESQDTAVISGLTNGTTYTFTVTADSAGGASAASDNSNPVTPEPGSEGAPTGPTTAGGTASTGLAGYSLVASDGGVFTFGDAGYFGSQGGKPLNRPIVGVAATPDGGGYWEVASDGGIFTFGDAGYFGSQGGKPLNRPIVGMAATPDGGGYWEVASDGGIFAFGDAGYFGSQGGKPLNRPIVGMAATPDGGGYWEVASDGGIFAFGDAGYYGSMGGRPLNAQIVGMSVTPSGQGYYMAASDGGIFAFGSAAFYGSMGGRPLIDPIVGIAATHDGAGYWEVASDGGIFNFGDAPFYGSQGGTVLNRPIVAMAGR